MDRLGKNTHHFYMEDLGKRSLDLKHIKKKKSNEKKALFL